MPVHYAGVACSMDRIMAIAETHGLRVIEDAAQGVNASYRGRALGSIGHLGAYSFHQTKNYHCGEGGALCINAPELVDRAEILRDKGTNRRQFLRGEVQRYTWVDVGSSHSLTELAGAFLYGQLEAMDEMLDLRRRPYETYRSLLKPLEDAGVLRLPRADRDCRSNCHTFFVLLEDGATRDALQSHLSANGIDAVFHYVPPHTSPMGGRLGYREGELPVTGGVGRRILRLPLYYSLTEDDQRRVARHLAEFFGHVQPRASGPRHVPAFD